jgi:hypothetical protein
MPKRVATLERDARGYPVPVVVLRDEQRRPVFARIETGRIWTAVLERRCTICGLSFAVDELMWSTVDGPMMSGLRAGAVARDG